MEGLFSQADNSNVREVRKWKRLQNLKTDFDHKTLGLISITQKSELSIDSRATMCDVERIRNLLVV